MIRSDSLLDIIIRQRRFSQKAFGPGYRTRSIVTHIRKELVEVLEAPDDLDEWIDVIILGLDGAWRTGATPADILVTLQRKQEKNERRRWPDWRMIGQDKPIEHIK